MTIFQQDWGGAHTAYDSAMENWELATLLAKQAIDARHARHKIQVSYLTRAAITFGIISVEAAFQVAIHCDSHRESPVIPLDVAEAIMQGGRGINLWDCMAEHCKFEKGRLPYQMFATIIAYRNDIVHPKKMLTKTQLSRIREFECIEGMTKSLNCSLEMILLIYLNLKLSDGGFREWGHSRLVAAIGQSQEASPVISRSD